MKKYTAFLLLVASLAGLGWLSVLATRMALAPKSPALMARTDNPSTKAGDEALRHVQSLDQALTQIDRLKPLLPSVSRKGPLAQLSAPVSAPLSRQATVKVVVRPVPVISLVYVSSALHKAVINGKLYSVGDSLPNGNLVQEISLKQVVLKAGRHQRVLQVPQGDVVGSTVQSVVTSRQ